eukprot:557842-Hanusia_phi.AAC.1
MNFLIVLIGRNGLVREDDAKLYPFVFNHTVLKSFLTDDDRLRRVTLIKVILALRSDLLKFLLNQQPCSAWQSVLLSPAMMNEFAPLHLVSSMRWEKRYSFQRQLANLTGWENSEESFVMAGLNWNLAIRGQSGAMAGAIELMDDLHDTEEVSLQVTVQGIERQCNFSAKQKMFEISQTNCKNQLSVNILFKSYKSEPWLKQLTVKECKSEQKAIIGILLKSGIDKDMTNEDDMLAFSCAVEADLPENIISQLLPSNPVQAFAGACKREAVSERELEMLAKSLKEAPSIDVRLLFLSPNLTEGHLLKVLPSLLRLSKTDICLEALKAAQNQKMWEAMKLITGECPESLELTDVPLCGAVKAGQHELVELLLARKADPDARTGEFNTAALHQAVKCKDLKMISSLLDARADINLNSEKGTCLHILAETNLDQTVSEITKHLLGRGADMTLKNKKNKTALQLCKGLLKEMLQKHQEHQLSGNKSQARRTKARQKNKLQEDTKTEESRIELAGSKAELIVKVEEAPRTSINRKPDPVSEKTPETLAQYTQSVRELLDSIRMGMDQKDELARRNDYVDDGDVKDDDGDVKDYANHNDDEEKTEELKFNRQTELSLQDAERPPANALNSIKDAGESLRTSPRDADEAKLRTEAANVGEGGSTSADERSVLRDLANCRWDLRVTREFKDQLFGLYREPAVLRSTVQKIKRLANGEQGRSLVKCLKGTPKHLKIFESPCVSFDDGRRFLWQYAVDYSPRISAFTDTIRLWKICLDHDDVPRGMRFIVDAHKRGRQSSVEKKLTPIFVESTFQKDGTRMPRVYKLSDDADLDGLRSEEDRKFSTIVDSEEEMYDQNEELIFTPPAVCTAESLNVLKFYALSDEFLKSLSDFEKNKMSLQRAEAAFPEFPFIPDDREDEIINRRIANSTCSTILVGRSGTGKTSIAINRMWKMYCCLSVNEAKTQDYNQVFVTANRVLRDQVRKSFKNMQAGLQPVDQLGSYPASLWDVASDAFPLFLTQSEWLQMLDATLPQPFWPRKEDGSLVTAAASSFHEEVGMLDTIPLDDRGFLVDEDLEDLVEAGGDVKARAKEKVLQREEVDFKTFESRIWPVMTRHGNCKWLSPSSVFQEIHSYIKGSVQALKSPQGFLSREEYLHMPAKMAPNFKGLRANDALEDLPGDRRGSRDEIYSLFQMYEKEKRSLNMYDIADVTHHIYKHYDVNAPQRQKVHSIYVDEAQDFTQSELALFFKVCEDTNDMFFSGDTCQTIATGIGFRFEDLKSLFKQEGAERSQSAIAPDVCTLTVNYRTHNGILGAASSVVSLLETLFPAFIDVLPKERGFFLGPRPMLLKETDIDDIAMLILGADRKQSQIEFGAHQVILVRSQEAKDRLPHFFDGCLAMTVLEAKGLEFDDVILSEPGMESRPLLFAAGTRIRGAQAAGEASRCEQGLDGEAEASGV